MGKLVNQMATTTEIMEMFVTVYYYVYPGVVQVRCTRYVPDTTGTSGREDLLAGLVPTWGIN